LRPKLFLHANLVIAAIYVAILDNRVAVNLPKDVSSAALGAGLPETSLTDLLEAVSAGTTSAMEAVPGINENIMTAVFNAVKTAYSQSFRTVFLVSIAFGGLAVVAAFASVPVDEKLDNAVAAKLSGTGADNEVQNEEEKEEYGRSRVEVSS
jgi:hypothetical protein